MDQLWFWLHPFDPAQHGGWAMAPVLPFFVRHVLLEIVIGHPFVMGCQQILPSVRFLKAPVGHASLNAKRRFYIILIGPSFLISFFSMPSCSHTRLVACEMKTLPLSLT